jgi:hypothetical protein
MNWFPQSGDLGMGEKVFKMRSKQHHMRRPAATVLACLLLLAAATPSQALDDAPSMRCAVNTVAVGDTQYAVREACGVPDKITISGGGSIESWTYNFGPTEFIHYLKFVHNRLERIQVGEYGFKKE